MDKSEKARENQLRRAAERQGLRLERSRRRDPRALGYGTYKLTDARTGELVAGDADYYGLSMDDVEKTLNGGRT